MYLIENAENVVWHNFYKIDTWQKCVDQKCEDEEDVWDDAADGIGNAGDARLRKNDKTLGSVL